jgi:hypothetical protein
MKLFKKDDTNGCECDECCGLSSKIGKYLPIALPLLIVFTAILEMSFSSALIGLAIMVLLYQLQKINDKIENCGPWY